MECALSGAKLSGVEPCDVKDGFLSAAAPVSRAMANYLPPKITSPVLRVLCEQSTSPVNRQRRGQDWQPRFIVIGLQERIWNALRTARLPARWIGFSVV